MKFLTSYQTKTSPTQNWISKVFYLSFFILLIACNNEENRINNEEETEPLIDFNLVSVEMEALPDDCKYLGFVEDVYSWHDLNGKNFIIRTMTSAEIIENETDDSRSISQYLYIYHYSQDKTGKVILLAEHKDAVEDCEFDLIMTHIEMALTVTDIDKDQYGEVTFVYRKTCTSDISPSEQILGMFENTDTYFINGYSEIMGEGGTYTEGEEFKNAPNGFHRHAVQIWDAYKVEL